jgi:uncharacterized protein (DUF2062 family)
MKTRAISDFSKNEQLSAEQGMEESRIRGWKKVKRTLRKLLLQYKSPRQLAFAVALGIFIGSSPLWGLHSLLAIGSAFVLRLNKSAVLLASFISNPWIAPFLIFASLETGSLILHGHASLLSYGEIQSLLSNPDWKDLFSDYFVPYFCGAFLVALVLAFITYWIVLWMARENGLQPENGDQGSGAGDQG